MKHKLELFKQRIDTNFFTGIHTTYNRPTFSKCCHITCGKTVLLVNGERKEQRAMLIKAAQDRKDTKRTLLQSTRNYVILYRSYITRTYQERSVTRKVEE